MSDNRTFWLKANDVKTGTATLRYLQQSIPPVILLDLKIPDYSCPDKFWPRRGFENLLYKGKNFSG